MKAFVIVETTIRTQDRVTLEIPDDIKTRYENLLEMGSEQQAEDLLTDHILSHRYDEALAKAPSHHHQDAEDSAVVIVQAWSDE